jgi:hypothetical protein
MTAQSPGDSSYNEMSCIADGRKKVLVMPETTLEDRVGALEKQVAELMQRVLASPPEKDWRSTIGMFADDPIMKEIQEEGRRIREADREQARRDHP